MPFDAKTNFGRAAVTAAPSPATSGTSLTIDTVALLPAVPFNATIYPSGEVPLASNAEIVRVTNIAGLVLTITRAQEGSTARTIVIGDQFVAGLTRKALEDIEGAIPSIAGLLSNINVSAGAASANLSALTFSNASGVSFGLNGSVITAAVETNYQSTGAYLTTAALSQDSSKYAGTNGAITGGSITVNTAGVSVNLPAYLTTARASTDALGLNTAGSNLTWTANSSGVSIDARGYAGTGTSATNASLTLNSNGLAISVGAGGHNVTLAGNTAGVLAEVSTGTLTIAGGNNITVSQAGNAITISGANAGGAQTGISGIVVSDTTYTSGTVSFSGNNITIASSVNGATQYIKLSGVAAQTTQSAIEGFGVSDTGNTAGNTGISTGVDWVLAGSGSITLSQSTAAGTNTVWIQHPAWLTTAALSQDSSKYAGTNGAITGGSITVNTSGVSVNLPAYLTTAALSGDTSKYVQAWELTGNTAGTTSSAQGTKLYFSGGNNVTVSGNSNSIVLSVGNYLTTADLSANSSKYVQEWALTGNTAGTTSSAQGTRLYLSGGNSITISGNSNSLVFSVGNYLTTARASTDAIGLNTAKTNVTWTVNSSGLSFDAGGYAGTGTSATNASITLNTAGLAISVAAPGAAAESNWHTLQGNVVGSSSASGSTIAFSGGNGVTLSGTNNSIIGISVSTYNTLAVTTVGTATSGYPVASANSIGTVTRWAAEDHRHAGIGGLGISTSGNTAGTTGSVQGTYWFQGGNNITLSQITSNNGSHTLVVSGATPPIATTGFDVASANSLGTVTRYAAEDHRHAGIGAIGISTEGNTSGTSGSKQGTYWLQGGNNITLSQITSNNGSHTALILGDALVSQYDPFQGIAPITNSTLGQSSIYFAPFDVMAAISASRINFFFSVGTVFSGAPNNQTCSAAAGYALYTRGTGTASDRISTVTSYSLSWFSGSCSSSTRLSATYYIGLSNATSHSTSQYGVNNVSVSDQIGSSVGGFRVLALPMNMTMSPGRYWLAFSNQTASQNASFIVNNSVVQIQVSNNIAFRAFNAVSAASNASVFDASNGAGTYSAQSAGFPNTIPLTVSDIRAAPVVTFPYFNISGIQTATNIL